MITLGDTLTADFESIQPGTMKGSMSRAAAPKVPTKGHQAVDFLVGEVGAVYLAVFFLSSAPALMTAELMRDLHIGTPGLVNIFAFCFYFPLALQIPIGAHAVEVL